MTRPVVCVVGARDSAVEHVGDVPVDIVALTGPGGSTSTLRRRCLAVHELDLTDRTGLKAALERLHRAHGLSGAVAFHDDHAVLTSDVAAELSIRANPAAAAATASDKAETRRAAAAAGLRNPEHSLVGSPDELRDALSRPGTWVVKPVGSSASQGVEVLDRDPGALEAKGPWPMLVEGFIDGPEVSVETVSADGVHEIVNITAKTVAGGQHPVELAHTTPADLSLRARTQIEADAVKVLHAIGHRWGPAHTEFRLDRDGWVLLETHTRYGGDRIWELSGLTTGNYPQRAALQALGGLPMQPLPRRAPAAAVAFLTGPEGRISALEVPPRDALPPGVIRLDVRSRTGDAVRPLRSSFDRLGYALAIGSTPSEALTRAHAALAKVKLTVQQCAP